MTKTYKSPSRVDDEATGKRRYFDHYEDARSYVLRALADAQSKNQQTVDRFYIWCAGECYSFGLAS
jgi:hypothetical protein